MANFSVPVLRIDAIEKHPNADSLEIAVLRGFRCIVKIGEFEPGDIAVYIPEASVLPDWLLRKLGLWDEEKEKGKLAGTAGNRVKAVKLRGIVSQGLLYPIFLDQDNLPFIDTEDDTYTLYDFEHSDLEVVKSRCIDIDVAPELGITKYEPPVPSHMSGEVCNIFGHTMKYDIENIQNHTNVLVPGEEVVFTEKLHGTWACFGFYPGLDHPELYLGGTIITSKGLSEKGLAFKWNEANDRNLYVSAFKSVILNSGIWDVVVNIAGDISRPVYILGEIFGQGVQDLHYGQKDKQFRVFDIYYGKPGEGQYLSVNYLIQACEELNLTMVPILYRGAFSMDVLEQYRDGKDTISGSHVREGVVITPVEERDDFVLGRVRLKAVSPDYLLRKGKATEYN